MNVMNDKGKYGGDIAEKDTTSIRVEKILKDLTEMNAVSGNEHSMGKLLKSCFSAYCDEVETDRFGNVIGLKKGLAQKRKIMVIAHYDEIGFMVKSIDKNGFIMFTTVGGIDPKILLAQEVVVHGKEDVYGIIGAKPPHLLNPEESKKPAEVKSLYIDTGMGEEKLGKIISVGDFISLKSEFLKLSSGMVSSKSFDNRCSITAILIAMERLSRIKHEQDVYFVASVQEEVFLAGAIMASYNLKPDIAIVLDVCSGETPNVPKEKTSSCGKGPAIAIGPILNRELTANLIDIAKDEDIPYQIAIEPGSTGTEAYATQVSRCGIPTVLISIPLKYMHTGIETISTKDVKTCGKLVSEYILSIDKVIRKEI